MEVGIALAVFGVGAAWLQSLWRRHRAQIVAARRRQLAVDAARRRQAETDRQQRQRQAAARRFQLAILELRAAPDFRRAAACAAAARDVPVEFRRRQFHRLRPLLVTHVMEQLRKGAPAEAIAEGLSELVVALGIADYEADYILTEATTRRSRPIAPAPAHFEDQVRQWQGEHQSRMETLQNLTDIDPELREQLLEQEEQRFHGQILAAGDPNAANDRVRL